MNTITVAVAGNPNSGKSTLINAIAGSHLQVGNWPGVTVEKKTATFNFEDLTINLVDLPGTYSLSPYTQEEVIARDFLVKEKPDLIINVVDATNLERNLYLTIQLLELQIPVIMALNIYDEAKKKGYQINIKKLESLLGIKVIPTVATKKEGIKELLQVIKETKTKVQSPLMYDYDIEIEEALSTIKEGIKKDYPELLQKYPLRWLSIKLLEGDALVLKETGLTGQESFLQTAKKHLIEAHDEDLESLLANIRYGLAHGITRQVLKMKDTGKMDITEKIDKIVLNRYLGIPIFLAIMWFVFKIAFDFSKPFSEWLDKLISGPVTHWISSGLQTLNASDWLVSLVTEGIVAGVGAVLVFTPLIASVMFLLTLFEGSGYMARVAFVMDRLMHSIGLHGKSFIPMILGFGCNVPSIYATRVLETERDRKLTALLVPFMSCGARLPVYLIFIGAFFSHNAPTVLWSLYILGIVMAIILGFILKNTIFKGKTPVFIMELPPYRIPTIRNLMVHTWQKLKHFIIKAGTYILAASVVIWFLLNLPYGTSKENSYLGRIGQTLSPLFEPLGFGKWEASSALVTGLIAKEVVVSTMAQLYGVEEEKTEKAQELSFTEEIKEIVVSFGYAVRDAFYNIFSFGIKTLTPEEEENAGLVDKLKSAFNPISAYSFMVFVLLYWPCVVTGIAMKQEFGTWKIYGIAMILHSTLAWITAFLVYQIGKTIGF